MTGKPTKGNFWHTALDLFAAHCIRCMGIQSLMEGRLCSLRAQPNSIDRLEGTDVLPSTTLGWEKAYSPCLWASSFTFVGVYPNTRTNITKCRN